MIGAKLCMQRLSCLLRTLCSSTLDTNIKSLLSLLQTATDVRQLHQIHAHMIISGTIKDTFAASRLLSSPALVEPSYARLIFSQISSPNLFIWNTLIKKLVENGMDSMSPPPLLVYKQMLKTSVRPNSHTFMYLIKALQAQLDLYLHEGEAIHSNVVKFGCESSQFVSSALLGFYVACGFVDRARRVFDKISERGLVLWTAMMRAYVCANVSEEALRLFGEMRQLGFMPDPVTLATIVSACGQLGNLDTAKVIHGFITKSGVEVDAFVSSGLLGMYGDCGSLEFTYNLFCEMSAKNEVIWNTMIHQCAKNGNMDLAYQLFKMMPGADIVSWNTMIGGLAHAGRCKEALALFNEMELYGVKPNRLTLSITLSACAGLGALDTGTWIHAYIEKNSLNSDGSLDPGLIDMYAKCGSIDKALQVFEKTTRTDLFSWTSIICGLAMHGHAKQAINYFSQMLEAGVQPDDVTLVGILNACAHSGFLDQGWQYFLSMEKVHSLTPKLEHYGCMVDLLGRMGCLKEAYSLIRGMPMEPNEVIWGTLLSACRVHNNVELGELAAQRLLQLDPTDPYIRVMLSNIYAEASRWDGVIRIRKELKERGLRKEPGCSKIEVNGVVYEFLVGDSLHAQQIEIHSMLDKLEIMLKTGCH